MAWLYPSTTEISVLNEETNDHQHNRNMAMTDFAIAGKNHSYMAGEIWLNSCSSNNNMIAYLVDLYPSLIEEFKRLTKCDKRYPTFQQIETFFIRCGGIYHHINKCELIVEGLWRSMNKQQPLPIDVISVCTKYYIMLYEKDKMFPYIRHDKFNKFFAWFRSMCCIIKDLRPIYNRDEDPLIGLFYARTIAQEALQHKPEGTFILRLSSQQNGLAITYKIPHGKIQNVLLTRTGNETYKVGKSDKETLLFQLIRPWPKLKYLYTPNKLIRKKFIF